MSHPNLNTLALPNLYAALTATGLVTRLLALAFEEDLGPYTEPLDHEGHSQPIGDITTECCIPPSRMAGAHLVARKGGVVSGLAVADETARLFAPGCRVTTLVSDGATVPPLTTIAVIEGPLDELLALERTLLNLIGRLSGIATRTAQFVARIPPASRARLFDTRKTTPGLRVLEKYAVRCGGGFCHRIGLYDAVLIKDNHIAGTPLAALPSVITSAAARARALGASRGHPPSFIEVEVDSLPQFEALLSLPPGTIDIVLLDNMGPDLLHAASARRDAVNTSLQLESSGGVTLETLPALAATGVDRISVGGLTHSAVSLDVALDVVETHEAATRP